MIKDCINLWSPFAELGQKYVKVKLILVCPLMSPSGVRLSSYTTAHPKMQQAGIWSDGFTKLRG